MGMLELRDIKKTYRIGDIETKALDGVSLSFRKKEFVAILGTSGSGKTTCLNIIGGLDRYDSGDLIIKGKSTKDFKEKDWDAYRNNTIGFVFQSYNLISHLSIVANVEMGMTLSGVSAVEKKKRALEALEKVGLKEHLHKKPNQLSGGQMQRVAIARALANDPEILLCDEPTGALDTATSIQIMDLIKEVAKDRLVIMVTHNPELAKDYADRIISFKDGNIIDDTNPYKESSKGSDFNLKKTSMSFATALRLSFNNIRTKKGRTFLTAFASSIGIIGIAVILSLSTGFQDKIDEYQADALAEFPIIISESAMEVDMESMSQKMQEISNLYADMEQYSDAKEVYLYDPSQFTMLHTNNLTKDYIDYVEAVDPEICQSVGYTRLVNMNLVRKTEDGIVPVTLSNAMESMSGGMGMMTSMSGVGLSSYPTSLSEGGESYLEKNYDLLAGNYPADETDLVLVVDSKNRVDYSVFERLGFDTEELESLDFDQIVGTTLTLVSNDSYYIQSEYGNFLPGTDYEAMYHADDSITLTISGIVRQKEDVTMALLAGGIAYSDDLSKLVISRAKDSAIVKAQEEADYNVMNMEAMEEAEKEQFLSYLGADGIPYMIMMYPSNFENKDAILTYLDAYNDGKATEDSILYTDLASSITSMTSGIMDGITIVLVAFAAISLVVSLIMICIITYTSVLERTKEIGILKALGARKKDIIRVFDAETFILGIFSGVLGVVIALLLTIPINQVIYNLTDLDGVASLQFSHAVSLVVVSTVLTVLGGHIPARMASKKDAVVALRSE